MKIKLSLAAVATSAALMCAGQAQAQTEITYATYLGAKHSTIPVLEEYFANVEKGTGGSIKFNFHLGASLLPIKAIPSGIRDGIADGGYMVGAVVPSEMKVDSYLSEFGLYGKNPLVMSAVYNDLVLFNCPQCQSEYRDSFKVMPLAGYATTPYLLQCVPMINSIEDVKGLKIKSTAARAELARAMGAVPFNVAANETYEAMDRGTVDCAFAAITQAKTRSYWEVVSNILTTSMGTWFGANLMNVRLEKWNELTPEEKSAMIKNLPKVVSDATWNYIEQDIEVAKQAKERGLVLKEAPDDIKAFVEKFRKDYGSQAIANGKERGVEDPKAIHDAFFAMLGKWEKLIGDKKWDRESYRQLLWDEIYSKLAQQQS